MPAQKLALDGDETCAVDLREGATAMNERSIFMEALEFDDPREREAHILRACGGDERLRARVEALLRRHQSDDVLALDRVPDVDLSVTADLPPAAEQPGTVIGPYKLLEQIGEGGMGVVFMAEQTRPMRRKAALKIIKPGMDTKQVIARFEAERQALALMDHPNIARVLDAGATEAGRPYFVMELVRGIPITDYCDREKLSISHRLELFVQVCQAVQHAHQKGIIHRDLKPSNVLITLHDGVPVPKVIDFGIAKATGQQLTEKTLFTGFAQFVGTPLYMSPEQAELSGLDIDTRSDIYSLGVLLYELLTGTTPFDRETFRTAAFDEIRRIIREQEPPKPSTRLSTLGDTIAAVSGNRGSDPRKLTHSVRGELDWVVMKCLEKDRTRRYETASGLAADVRRHLQDEPVEACPPSASYRLCKSARKHRRALTTAAAFAGLLVLASVLSTILAVRATRAERQATADRNRALFAEAKATEERDRSLTAEAAARKAAAKAEAVSKFLLADMLTEMAPGGSLGRVATVEQLLDNAAARVNQAFSGQPELEAAIHDKIGATYGALSRYDKGHRQLVAALEIQRRVLGDEHPDTLQTTHDLAVLLTFQDKWAEAERLARKLLEIRQRVQGNEHLETLTAMSDLGWVLTIQRKFAEAEPLARKALDVTRRLLGDGDISTVERMERLAGLHLFKSEPDEAEPLLLAALEIRRRVSGEEHPRTLEDMHELAWLRGVQVRLLGRQVGGESVALLRKVLEIRRRVLGEEHYNTLNTMCDLAGYLFDQGKPAEAEPLAREALSTARRVLGREHTRTVESMHILGETLHALGKLAEAEPLLREAVEIRRKTDPRGYPDLGYALTGLGWVLLDKGEPAQAQPLLREALAICQKRAQHDQPAEAGPSPHESPDNQEKDWHHVWLRFQTMSLLGASLLGQREYAEAEPLLIRGYEGLKSREARFFPQLKKTVPEAAARLVQLYEAWGKPEKAAEWRHKLTAAKEVPHPSKGR
jgi:serine/threonine protein kinase/tetratricopeptide (TPR) repeat protein